MNIVAVFVAWLYWYAFSFLNGRASHSIIQESIVCFYFFRPKYSHYWVHLLTSLHLIGCAVKMLMARIVFLALVIGLYIFINIYGFMLVFYCFSNRVETCILKQTRILKHFPREPKVLQDPGLCVTALSLTKVEICTSRNEVPQVSCDNVAQGRWKVLLVKYFLV